MGGEALQDGQGLALADAGEDGHVHSAQVVPDVDPAGEDHVVQLQLLDQIKALLGVFVALLPGPHDPELQGRLPLLGGAEGLDHGLDVLDGADAQHGAHVDMALVLLRPARQVLEPLHGDAVGRDGGFLLRAVQLDLQEAGLLIQAGHQVGPPVGQAGHLFELVDPHILVQPLDPLGLHQVLLPLAGVDAVLGDQQGAAVQVLAHAAQHARVPGGQAVV